MLLINIQRIDALLSWIYSLAKRSQRLRNVLLPIRRFVMSLIAWGRALQKGAVSAGAPTKYTSATAWFNSPLGSGKHTQIYPRLTLHRSLPGTIEEEVHWCFKATRTRELAPAAVAGILRGRALVTGREMWDQNVVVITPDNTLLTDFSAEISGPDYLEDVREYKVFSVEKLPPVRKIKGTVALLTAPAGGGYYHWMLQVLPRLHLLEKNGIPLSSIDKFIVNLCVSRFQKETLDLLGIPQKKVIQSQWNPHIEAEKLVVATLPEEPPGWTCTFVRDAFLKNGLEAREGGEPERLYVRRTGTNHRKVVNEAEVAAHLERYGFHTIQAEKLSITEQARLMASAKVVIGPHGAGMSNIVFCNPGTKVIELFSSGGVSPLFWGLANVRNLEYYYLIGEGPRLPKHTPYRPQLGQDMQINIAHLSRIMKQAGIEAA